MVFARQLIRPALSATSFAGSSSFRFPFIKFSLITLSSPPHRSGHHRHRFTGPGLFIGTGIAFIGTATGSASHSASVSVTWAWGTGHTGLPSSHRLHLGQHRHRHRAIGTGTGHRAWHRPASPAPASPRRAWPIRPGASGSLPAHARRSLAGHHYSISQPPPAGQVHRLPLLRFRIR